jgi:hypothetical protein
LEEQKSESSLEAIPGHSQFINNKRFSNFWRLLFFVNRNYVLQLSKHYFSIILLRLINILKNLLCFLIVLIFENNKSFTIFSRFSCFWEPIAVLNGPLIESLILLISINLFVDDFVFNKVTNLSSWSNQYLSDTQNKKCKNTGSGP